MIEVGAYVSDNMKRLGVVHRVTHDDDGCVLWVRWMGALNLTPCFAYDVEVL